MKNAASLSRLILCLGIVAGLSASMGIARAQRAPAAILGSGPFVYHSLAADFRVVVIAKGLAHPWSTAFLPDGSILVTERPGRLRIIRNGVLDPTPVSGVPPVYSEGATNGLLDIALDPDFARNHYVYLSYNKPVHLGPNYVPISVLTPTAIMGRKGSGQNAMTDAIARGVWNGHALTHVRDIFVDDNVIDDSIGIGQDSAVRIVFGRDGKLYMGTGAGDVPANSGKYAHSKGGRAQDPTSDGGKVLRLNSDGTIPKDNPFVGKPGYRPEIYTMGHRNITGMAVNPFTGEIWEAENGPQDDDKLIILDKPGANYGWPIVGVGYDYSGDHIGGPIALGDPSAVSPGYLNGYLPGITQPFLIWVPAMAPSGLAFYTGDQFPKWKGSIFVGSLKYHRLERHVLNDRGGPIRREYLLEDLQQRIRDVRQGPDGDLYVLTDEDPGVVLRIEPIEAH